MTNTPWLNRILVSTLLSVVLFPMAVGVLIIVVVGPGAATTSTQPSATVSQVAVDLDTEGSMVRVRGFTVHSSLASNLAALLQDAEQDGIIMGGWGYRTTQRQIELRRKHCGTSHYAIYQKPSSQCSPPTARPGTSQHEVGLAIDFTCNGRSVNRVSSCFRWLQANAAQFGLKNLPSEPWHWSTTGR